MIVEGWYIRASDYGDAVHYGTNIFGEAKKIPINLTEIKLISSRTLMRPCSGGRYVCNPGFLVHLKDGNYVAVLDYERNKLLYKIESLEK